LNKKYSKLFTLPGHRASCYQTTLFNEHQSNSRKIGHVAGRFCSTIGRRNGAFTTGRTLPGRSAHHGAGAKNHPRISEPDTTMPNSSTTAEGQADGSVKPVPARRSQAGRTCSVQPLPLNIKALRPIAPILMKAIAMLRRWRPCCGC